VVSTTKEVVALCTKMLLRSRLSFELYEWHTSHGHAIIGTPLLVPVPKKVMVSGGQCIAIKSKIKKLSAKHFVVK